MQVVENRDKTLPRSAHRHAQGVERLQANKRRSGLKAGSGNACGFRRIIEACGTPFRKNAGAGG